MSTKDLSRTVIEGGRDAYNRWDRRNSNARERVAARQLSRGLCRAVELDDVVYGGRQKVYRGFRDKLRPAMRWLESQVGRPWNKVWGELVARFDTRTTAGRHIVFDHLLPEVEGPFPYRGFRVDRRGLLKKMPPRPRRTRPAREPLGEPHEEIERWLAGRAIATVGSAPYWFVPTRSGWLRQDRRLTPGEKQRWLALPTWFRGENDAAAVVSRKQATCPQR